MRGCNGTRGRTEWRLKGRSKERNGTVQQKGVAQQRIKDDYRTTRWLLAS